MNLPQNSSQLLKYGALPVDEYFAPYFEVVAETGELLWPFSTNASKVQRANFVRRSTQQIYSGGNWINVNYTIFKVQNPFFAVYPAWNTESRIFNFFLVVHDNSHLLLSFFFEMWTF